MVAGGADGAGDQEMIEVDLDFIQMHEVGCCAAGCMLSCCVFE